MRSIYRLSRCRWARFALLFLGGVRWLLHSILVVGGEKGATWPTAIRWLVVAGVSRGPAVQE